MRSVRTPDATYRRKVAVSYVLFDAVFLALRYLPIACLRLVDCRGFALTHFSNNQTRARARNFIASTRKP